MKDSLMRFGNSISNFYQSNRARQAIKTGAAAVIAVLLYNIFNLPNGYWAVITAVIIMQSNMESGSLETTLKIALQRFVGTAMGAITGFVIALLFSFNLWELLVCIFALIFIGTLLIQLYQGFNLFGPTAIIVLMLSHQGPITQNIAFIRSFEILLGVVIAVITTVSIWPYRIIDHLSISRKKRLRLISNQLSSLIRVTEGETLPENWKKEQNIIISSTKNEQKHIDVAPGRIKEKEQHYLDLQLDLVKFLTRLGEALPNMSDNFWNVKALNTAICKLLSILNSTLNNIGDDETRHNGCTAISAANDQLLSSFDDFRQDYRKSSKQFLTIEEGYQIFSVIQCLSQCAQITLEICMTKK